MSGPALAQQGERVRDGPASPPASPGRPRPGPAPMLFGAHVSTAGGLDNAIERGAERGCESIQIFNQSPRMWRPTNYGPDDFAAFNEAMAASPVEAVVIHAVYLINCATKDRELRKKSLASLTHALRIGDGIGAAGVVLHPGAQKGEPLGPSMKRAAKVIAAALERQRALPAPARADRRPQRPARARLRPDRRADRAGRRRQAPRPLPRLLPPLRTGLRRDRPEATWAEIVDEADAKVGLDRLRCLHVNDAAAPLGSCRDRHANIGKGEMGKQGLAAFLSEPRFEGLPATLETPGPNKKGPDRKEVQAAKRLRKAGLKAR